MKILDIIPYVPYPLDSGGNQAVFNMLVAMAEKHEVHLLLRVNSAKNVSQISKLQEKLPSVIIHVCDERPVIIEEKYEDNVKSLDDMVKYTLSMRFFDYLQKSMGRKIERRKNKQLNKLMVSEFSKVRVDEEEKRDDKDNTVNKGVKAVVCDLVKANTTLYHYLPEYTSKYVQFVYETSRLGFDVIQCEFYETLGLGRVLPDNVKKIFVHHELRYIRNRNEMELFGTVTPMDIFTYKKLKEDELSSLCNFNTVVVLTDTDKQLLLQENGGLNIYVSPAVVKYESSPMQFKQALDELVFVGSGDHFPNYDGLLWYCKSVAPLLRELGKEPKLYVTGVWRDVKRDVILATGANVEFVGFVDDLHGFVNGKVSIVPIRIGSGMRMKILDAIDSASPIVSTKKGCEGLDFMDDVDMIICDDERKYAESILKVLVDKNLQSRLVKNSKEKLARVFTPLKQIETRLKLY